MTARDESLERLAWLTRLEAAGTLLIQDLGSSRLNGHRELLAEAEAFLRMIVAERAELERG